MSILSIMGELLCTNFFYEKENTKQNKKSLVVTDLSYEGFKQDKSNFNNDIYMIFEDISNAQKQIT